MRVGVFVVHVLIFHKTLRLFIDDLLCEITFNGFGCEILVVLIFFTKLLTL
jgi:hypothetical protein